jgi:hypothetical protein
MSRMLASYATGLIGIAIVLLFWVWVQTAWRRTFPRVFDDPDVLAERVGCDGCDRTDACTRLVGACAATDEECT